MNFARVLCLSCALVCAGAAAQNYPAKPVRFVVPYPPGGSNDVLSRITAQAMTPGLGQQIVVENRSGAGGMIGADQVAKSAPDGYSLLNVQASFTANAALRAKMAYDPISDFAYIGMMARGPLLVVVHPSLPANSIKELIALARARPGQINYGSTGTGGHNHLATELFNRMARVQTVHVPYKGVAPALTDLMGGHTQLVFTSLPSAMNQVQAGRLKALAVGSEQRTSFMPDLPTMSAGVLASELGKALQSPELRKRFAHEGAEPSSLSREQFTKFVANEIQRWRKVAVDSGIKPD